MAQVKKKKQPKNAFFFFMMHFKKSEESKGATFPGGMKEVAERATPKWKNMRPDDKFVFEETARKEKERDKTDLENKFTTQGKSYAQLEREKNEEAEKHIRMMNDIKGTVRSLDYSSTLQTHTFHVIHVNFFCRQEEGIYTPCEIGLAEFSFTDGVRKVYHTLINPGTIPLGYALEARKLSEETHNIPLPGAESEGEKNYYKIFNDIKNFVTKEENLYTEKERSFTGKKKRTILAPYYSHGESIKAAESVLSVMQQTFKDEIEFRIYPLTELFYELRNACAPDPARGFPTRTIAEMELERDVFNFTRGISCTFHEGTDAIPYCSLSYVRRWCFLIMDYCCKDLGIDLIPGQHCPRQAATTLYRVSSQSGSDTASFVSLNSSSVRRPNNYASAHPSEPTAGAVLRLGATPRVVSINKEPEPLVPLRLPRTQPEACKGLDLHFSDEDFPAIGSRKHVPAGVQESEPIAVAGRGRMASRFNIPIGRGRGLSNLDADFEQMNLK